MAADDQSSPDGLNWGAAPRIPGSPPTFDVAYGGFKFVVTGRGNVYILGQDNTWSTNPFPEQTNVVSIAAGIFGFVAVTDTGNAYRSPDGITWTQIMPYGQMKWTGEDNNDFFATTTQTITLPALPSPPAAPNTPDTITHLTVVSGITASSSINPPIPGQRIFASDGTHQANFSVITVTPNYSVAGYPYTLVLRWLNLKYDSTPGNIIASGAKLFTSGIKTAARYVRGSGQFNGSQISGPFSGTVNAALDSGSNYASVTPGSAVTGQFSGDVISGSFAGTTDINITGEFNGSLITDQFGGTTLQGSFNGQITNGTIGGTCFVGAVHEIVVPASYPGGRIVSVTWYPDLVSFVAKSVFTLGADASAAKKEFFFSSPDGFLWTQMPTPVANGDIASASAPGGRLKSVCFWQEGTFVVT